MTDTKAPEMVERKKRKGPIDAQTKRALLRYAKALLAERKALVAQLARLDAAIPALQTLVGPASLSQTEG
jgi:hypothetical protein